MTSDTLSRAKLLQKLKSRMIAVDSSTMPERTFLYSIGFNACAAGLLIDEANGEFDP